MEQGSDRVSLDRVVFFADAVFAIAITLLVVEIAVPKVARGELLDALGDQWAEFFSFALSFLVVGNWWLVHHRMFRYVVRADDRLLQLQLAFLLAIAFMPYPTALLGKYLDSPTAVILYAGTLSAVGLASAALWRHVTTAGLVSSALEPRRAEYFQLRSLVVPVVFLTSIPLAFMDATATELWWIWAYVLTAGLSVRYRDVAR